MHREIQAAITDKVTCNCKQLVLKILSWEFNGLGIILKREISAAVTKHEVFPSSSLKIITHCNFWVEQVESYMKVPVAKKANEKKTCA